MNTASPIDVTGTPATTTDSSRGDPPSVTPVTSGAVVIAAGAGMQTSSGTPFTVPAGMSNPVSYKRQRHHIGLRRLDRVCDMDQRGL